MKNWPSQIRPTEKLLQNNAQALSDAELLAVFIRHGIKDRHVMLIAGDLLEKFGDLRGIVSAHKSQIACIKGFGITRYAQMQAAFEIFRRNYEISLSRQSVFSSASDVHAYLRANLRDQQRELFGLLLLDSQHQLINFRILFFGTINAAAVYPRDVVSAVIAENAAAVILVHNHPSGIAEPSDADINVTQQIKGALALIDVSVLDHFIVGEEICSFAQRGIL